MAKWDLSKLPEGRKPLTDEWFAERAQMQERIEELEAKLDWVLVERDETFALMLDRAQTAEAKLAKAVVALDKIKRIDNIVGVFAACERTLAELTGGKDGT